MSVRLTELLHNIHINLTVETLLVLTGALIRSTDLEESCVAGFFYTCSEIKKRKFTIDVKQYSKLLEDCLSADVERTNSFLQLLKDNLALFLVTSQSK